MTINQPEKFKKFHLIYSIILSMFLVIAGLLLIIACVSIYNSGDNPFSRESVADAFSKIAIPVYICIILTIIGFVIDIIFTKNIEKKSPIKSYEYILNIMYKKRELTEDTPKLSEEITQLKGKRKRLSIIRYSVILICGIIFLLYALNSNNFSQTDINGSVIKAMLVLLPCLIVSFIVTLVTMIYNDMYLRNEIELIKLAPLKKTSDTNNNPNKVTNQKPMLIGRYIILALGLALLIFGFVTGGTVDVLTKAINICTECIGLG